jgi:hypothetical protein
MDLRGSEVRVEFRIGIEVYRLTETKVGGKKVNVTTAIALIALVSSVASSPIRTWILLSLCTALWKAYNSLVSSPPHTRLGSMRKFTRQLGIDRIMSSVFFDAVSRYEHPGLDDRNIRLPV